MHPRSRTRASITADSLRRNPAPRLVASAPTPIAFGIVEGGLAVVRAFEVNWPFSGRTLNVEPGTAIEPLCQDRWEGGDRMAIVSTPLFTDKHLLVAMPKRLADPGDILLGGFDLDATGAVLAGSFWDANLESVAPAPAPEAVQRIADIFVRRRRDGFDDTTQHDLVREGVAEADVVAHYEAAAAIAAGAHADRDIADTPATYDRQARVRLGAVALAGELDPNRVHTTLRLAGLTTREIGNLFDDIIGESLRLVRESGAAAIREVA